MKKNANHKIEGANESCEEDTAIADETDWDDGVLCKLGIPHSVHGYQDAADDDHCDHGSCSLILVLVDEHKISTHDYAIHL